MFRKIIIFFVVFSFALSVVSKVNAQGDFGLSNTASRAGYTSSQSDVYAIIGLTVNILLSILFIAFLGIMFYAGFRWMLARGNEELAGKAKTALEAGVIGLIVVLSAYAIANFVLTKLANSTSTSEGSNITCDVKNIGESCGGGKYCGVDSQSKYVCMDKWW